MAKVALITGGNGTTSSAILEHLTKNTTVDEWGRIILTSHSPLRTTVRHFRVEYITLNFSQDPKRLAQEMNPVCADVTHAYFSYVHMDNFTELNRANRHLFENLLQALLAVAGGRLQICTLQTGGKYYNVHPRPVPWPAPENQPRLTSADKNFYYHQEDFLVEKQRTSGLSWTSNVVRPEAIIGCTTKPNGMNEALMLALYFMTCKELRVKPRCPQTGTTGMELTTFLTRLIADLTIWGRPPIRIVRMKRSMLPTAIISPGGTYGSN